MNFTEFTIPEAVNLIVAVDDGSLQELGRKLGVDDARLRRLSSYDVSERHQRLIEAWFEQTTEPLRSTLLEALPRRDSSLLMSSVPPTPTSDSHSGKKKHSGFTCLAGNPCSCHAHWWELNVLRSMRVACIYRAS